MFETRFIRSTLPFLVCLFVVAGLGTAHAQTDAALIGQIVDPEGQPLPGVQVTAINEATGVERVAFTDQQGYYRIRALPIGTYTLSASLQGFSTVRREGIELRIGQEAVVDFSMQLASVEESITVTAEQPLVDLTKADVGTSVSEKQLQNLPVKERRWLDLSLIAPGTSQDNIRGQFYNNVNIGGGGQWYENGFTVDGVNNTWAEMGEARQNFPTDSIAEFQLVTQNFRAEDGWASGGMLKVVTKSGTNSYNGSGFWFFRNDNLSALGPFEQSKPSFDRHQFGGSFGGPIVENVAHFFGSVERFQSNQAYTVNTGGAFPEVEGTFTRDVWRNMATARIDWQAGDHQLFWRYGHEREDFPNKVAGGTSPVSLGFAVPRESMVFGDTWVISDRAVNELRFQYGYSMYQVYSKDGGYSYDPVSIDEAARAGRLEEHIAFQNCDQQINRPSVSLGDCGNQMGPEHRWQVRNDFSYYVSDWKGTHDFKMGADVNYIPFASDSGGYNLKGSFFFSTDEAFDAADPSTFPFLYTETRVATADVPVWHIAGYFQDAWSPANNLTMNLGLRYEVQRGSFNEDVDEIDFFHPGTKESIEIPWHTGAVEGFGSIEDRGDNNNFGPRLGVTYDPLGNGRTVIRGGYGVYYQSIRTLTNWGERLWHRRPSIFIVNPGYPNPFGPGQTFDDFISTAPPNIDLLSNSLINPYTHHISVGFTRQLGDRSAISADVVYMRGEGKRIGRDVNYFATQADLDAGIRPFPQFNEADMDLADGRVRYKSLYVKYEKRFSDGYQFVGSYTLSKSEDNITGVPPNQFTPETQFGPSDSDRRHRVRFSGIVEMPYGVMLSGSVRLESSLPFNAHSGTDLNGDGNGGDYIAGTHRNMGCRGLSLETVNAYREANGRAPVSEIRCPNGGSIDVRASKTFQLGDTGTSLEVIGQAFNILNADYFYPPVGNMLSGSFGQPVSAYEPLQVELAAKFTF